MEGEMSTSPGRAENAADAALRDGIERSVKTALRKLESDHSSVAVDEDPSSEAATEKADSEQTGQADLSDNANTSVMQAVSAAAVDDVSPLGFRFHEWQGEDFVQVKARLTALLSGERSDTRRVGQECVRK